MALVGKYYHLEFQQVDRNADNDLVENQVNIRIYDMSLEDETTFAYTIIELTGSGDPFHTSTIDNSDDKFTGIKPTQATIKFLSSDAVNMATFADTNIDVAAGGVEVGDPRWYVEAYLNDYLPQNFIFKGFLILDDCYEAFLPEKNEVILVANDGLGFLRNIPLSNFNGDNPKNENRIADFLAWGLSKTGLNLNLNTVFNIREASLGNDHFLDVVYLHSKTFEDVIGTSINCFDAIEKILGEEAYLCQRCGEWWLMRVDEVGNNHGYYTAVFDSDGVFQSISDEIFIMKSIEKDLTGIFFSQEETGVNLVRPHKYIKETFRFEYPEEIVDNIDFSRGEFINFNSGTLTARYDISDWEALEVPTGTFAGIGTASSTFNYIRRIFADINQTYEKERYVVIEAASPAKGFFIKSNPIPVQKNDKIDISVDSRFADDIFPTSGSYRISTMQVRLYGDDGSRYTLHGGSTVEPTLEWRVTSGSFASNMRVFVIEGNFTEDMRDWKTSSFISNSKDPNPCPPVPVDGNIEILLLHGTNSDQTDRHFSNLRFTYIPYINGSYSKYSGYSFKIFRDINYVNKREKQVYISDSQKKLFKGALFTLNTWVDIVSSASLFYTAAMSGDDNRIVLSIPTGDVRSSFPAGFKFRVTSTTNNNRIFTVTLTEFVSGSTIIHVDEDIIEEGSIPTATFQKATFDLTNRFYAWNDIHTSTPDEIYVHPYGHIQAHDVWNQHRNVIRKFQATCQGLGHGMMDQSGNFLGFPSLIHQYLLLDTNANTNDRIFMLLSFDIDWLTCEWKGTLIEGYNSIEGKHYDDNIETKYLT